MPSGKVGQIVSRDFCIIKDKTTKRIKILKRKHPNLCKTCNKLTEPFVKKYLGLADFDAIDYVKLHVLSVCLSVCKHDNSKNK